MSAMLKRKHRKPSRIKRLFFKSLTFMFSHVGLAAVAVVFMVGGAVVFKYIEAPHEIRTREEMILSRIKLKDDLWLMCHNKFIAVNKELLEDLLVNRSATFKYSLVAAIKRGYDGRSFNTTIQWSYPGAFFYSMTTISTVGYGNIACRTMLGRAVTIGYAIFGIPLMLLFLAIMGDSLSVTCKFLYRAWIRQRIRFLRWRYRRRLESRWNSALYRIIKTQLYHTAAMYGIRPQDAPIDEKLIAEGKQDVKSISVPIYVLITLMITYLVAGAALFHMWEEEWSFEEAFYFCFISLALIGFGDLFPGASVIESWEAITRIIICGFYLLFGMALIAMCFNLAQDNVIRKFRIYAKRLGLSGTGGSERRGSKSLDPHDIIVEGGPIGGPDEIPPLTLGDLQGPLIKPSKLVIPVYYGATGRTIRRQAVNHEFTNGTLSLSRTNSTKRAKLPYDSNSTQMSLALAKQAYILEGRRSF